MALPGVNCRRGRKADGYDVCWMLERLVCGLALTAMLFAWQPASWQAEAQLCQSDSEQKVANRWTSGCSRPDMLVRGIHDDDDNFTDIDTVKCCQAPVYTVPVTQTVTLQPGGSWLPADAWTSQCPQDYAVSAFINSHCQTCSFLDIVCTKVASGGSDRRAINTSACQTVRTVHGGTRTGSLVWNTECPVASVVTAVWTDRIHWKYNRPLRYIKCCPLDDPCLAYGLNCSRGFGICQTIHTPVASSVPGQTPPPQQYHCTCPAGITGQECTRDIDECAATSNSSGGGSVSTTTGVCGAGPGVRCRNAIGSYWCACADGFRPNITMATALSCVDIDECSMGTHGCIATSGPCQNTAGSYACRCRRGYTRDSSGQCRDADECAEIGTLCMPGGVCSNVAGSFHCTCRSGFELAAGGTLCTDRDECSPHTLALVCNGGTCINTVGSFDCVCPPDFALRNGTCTARSTCRSGSNDPCWPGGRCLVNGTGHRCVCAAGYHDAGGTCVETDPCAADADVCSSHGVCTSASYYCNCHSGYSFTNGTCAANQQKVSCGANATVYSNPSLRAPFCQCDPGFSLSNGTCVRMNPCDRIADGTFTVCGPNGQCLVTATGHMCVCEQGYVFQNGTCRDRDECVTTVAFCGVAHTARCINTPGSAVCICLRGFQWSAHDRQCVDLNECHDNETATQCGGVDGNCVNTDGSYRCVCLVGYHGDSADGSCLDDNECNDSPCGSDQNCENTLGSYRCSCPKGYVLVNSSCVDPGKCTVSSCGPNTSCTSQLGYAGVRCSCQNGHTWQNGSCVLQPRVTCGSLGASAACGNGSLCLERPDKRIQCVCQPGYDWLNGSCLRREIPLLTCLQVSCGPNATCQQSGAGEMPYCTCRRGYHWSNGSAQAGSSCVSVCDGMRCPANASCTLDAHTGAALCRCDVGYWQSGDGTCTHVLSTITKLRRTLNTSCNTLLNDSYSRCDRRLSAQKCNLTALCEQELCGPFAACNLDAEQKSMRCRCHDGYHMINDTCTDVNECTGDMLPCGSGLVGMCVNVPGSYRCLCYAGYKAMDAALTECVDTDECQENATRCGPGGHCVNEPGSYGCECSAGFSRIRAEIGERCENINECESDVGSLLCGDGGGTCVDLPGRYACNCTTGFELHYVMDSELALTASPTSSIAPNITCRDIDECLLYKDVCRPNGVCRNVPGSFVCDCLRGYQPSTADTYTAHTNLTTAASSGRVYDPLCSDVNECEQNTSLCRPHGECVNTPGAYSCRCSKGYTVRAQAMLNSAGSVVTCTDLDECVGSGSSNPCGPGACVNMAGSFHCRCPRGYAAAANGTECRDTDECDRALLAERPCTPGGSCINTDGSYRCLCLPGFELRTATVASSPKRSSQFSLHTNQSNITPQPTNSTVQHDAHNTTRKVAYDYLNTSRCLDIDECSAGLHHCIATAPCHNYAGGYLCLCSDGSIQRVLDDDGGVDARRDHGDPEQVGDHGDAGQSQCGRLASTGPESSISNQQSHGTSTIVLACILAIFIIIALLAIAVRCQNRRLAKRSLSPGMAAAFSNGRTRLISSTSSRLNNATFDNAAEWQGDLNDGICASGGQLELGAGEASNNGSELFAQYSIAHDGKRGQPPPQPQLSAVNPGFGLTGAVGDGGELELDDYLVGLPDVSVDDDETSNDVTPAAAVDHRTAQPHGSIANALYGLHVDLSPVCSVADSSSLPPSTAPPTIIQAEYCSSAASAKTEKDVDEPAGIIHAQTSASVFPVDRNRLECYVQASETGEDEEGFNNNDDDDNAITHI